MPQVSLGDYTHNGHGQYDRDGGLYRLRDEMEAVRWSINHHTEMLENAHTEGHVLGHTPHDIGLQLRADKAELIQLRLIERQLMELPA